MTQRTSQMRLTKPNGDMSDPMTLSTNSPAVFESQVAEIGVNVSDE